MPSCVTSQKERVSSPPSVAWANSCPSDSHSCGAVAPRFQSKSETTAGASVSVPALIQGFMRGMARWLMNTTCMCSQGQKRSDSPQDSQHPVQGVIQILPQNSFVSYACKMCLFRTHFSTNIAWCAIRNARWGKTLFLSEFIVRRLRIRERLLWQEGKLSGLHKKSLFQMFTKKISKIFFVD